MHDHSPMQPLINQLLVLILHSTQNALYLVNSMLADLQPGLIH